MNQKYHASVSFRQAVLCGLLAILLLAAAPAAWAQRVVAVGDIHGNYEGFTAILREAGLIDERDRWAGGRSILVQTGDFFDRGPDTRKVVDLLMELEKQAGRSGGQVIVLLGNHEVMNIMGDLRYVSEEEWASFADKRSESRRRAAFRQYSNWLRHRARHLGKPAPQITPAMEQRWMDARPLGFVEMREALSRSGKYGMWLRERQVIAKVGDTVFLHGGAHPALVALSIDELNSRIADEVKSFDVVLDYLVHNRIALPFFNLEEITDAVREELASGRAAHPDLLTNFLNYENWLSIHPTGPLWFRGFTSWSDEEGADAMDKLLPHYEAERFVTGHTVEADGRIRGRFDGRVFLIDTGMLSSHYLNGRPSALEIDEGKLTAIYLDKRTVLHSPRGTQMPAGKVFGEPRHIPGGGVAEESAPVPGEGRVWLGPEGQALPFKNDEEVLEFLRNARVRRMSRIGRGVLGVRKATLEHEGVQAHAVFRDHDETRTQFQGELHFRDSFIYEPAAYELALMLGLDSVPPTVLRRHGGKSGSMQLWVEQSFVEEQRQRDKRMPPDPVAWTRQLQTIWMFDELIQNVDRNMGNLLIDKDWKVWMIDHSRAFRRGRDLMTPQRLRLIHENVLERLRNLNADELNTRLRPYLNRPEIEGILARRDKLVEHFDNLIASHGKAMVVFTDAPPVSSVPEEMEE